MDRGGNRGGVPQCSEPALPVCSETLRRPHRIAGGHDYFSTATPHSGVFGRVSGGYAVLLVGQWRTPAADTTDPLRAAES